MAGAFFSSFAIKQLLVYTLMASCLTDWKLEKACETQIIAAKRATTLELVYILLHIIRLAGAES